MTWWKPTPRTMVIIYFGCFAAAWGGIAVLLSTAERGAIPVNAFHATHVSDFLIVGIIALAAHAFVVALLAWRAHRWLFAHGPVAVVLCGLPLIALREDALVRAGIPLPHRCAPRLARVAPRVDRTVAGAAAAFRGDRFVLRQPERPLDGQAESHVRIVRAAAAFGRHPMDVLPRVLDVAGLAVHAVRRVDLQPLA